MEHAFSLCLREGKKPSVSPYARDSNRITALAGGRYTVCCMTALHNMDPIKPALETCYREGKHFLSVQLIIIGRKYDFSSVLFTYRDPS